MSMLSSASSTPVIYFMKLLFDTPKRLAMSRYCPPSKPPQSHSQTNFHGNARSAASNSHLLVDMTHSLELYASTSGQTLDAFIVVRLTLSNSTWKVALDNRYIRLNPSSDSSHKTLIPKVRSLCIFGIRSRIAAVCSANINTVISFRNLRR